MAHLLTVTLLAGLSAGLGVGYNSECRMDSECRASTTLPDVCCAQLIYEANDVTIKKRVCLPKSTMEDAGGSYKDSDITGGVTTTDAYCDRANMLTTVGATALAATLVTAFF